MRYRNLGDSGLEVSVIGLATNNFGSRPTFPFHKGQDTATTVIHKALDQGINLIDTANSYGNGMSEQYIGNALKNKRHQAILATKVHTRMADGPNRSGSSRMHIMEEIEGSLKRLGTDYVDLYQLHGWDPITPTDETVRALDDLVSQGKIRYIGCSNFSGWQTGELIWVAKELGRTKLISVQPPYSMLERDIETELMPFCERYRIGILPYYPLAQGFLTGKYRRGEELPKGSRLSMTDRGVFTDKNFNILDEIVKFSEDRGHTVLELAFAWLLAKPAVSSVIAGATSPEQVESNALSGDWELTEDEMVQLEHIIR